MGLRRIYPEKYLTQLAVIRIPPLGTIIINIFTYCKHLGTVNSAKLSQRTQHEVDMLDPPYQR